VTPEVHIVQLEKLTYGGKALARLPDGRTVFVPYGLPSEEVAVRLVEQKRQHARADLVEVLKPSPERIQPRCRHFGSCGGCAYQHMPYEAQLKAKREILREQLERIGKISDPPLQPTVPSPQEWNYRNHVRFHLSETGKLGFRAAASSRVIPISECHLPEGPLNAIWPQLEFSPGLNLDRIGLRLGQEGQAMLVLESSSPETPEVEIESDLSVVHLCGEAGLVLAGEEAIEISVEIPQDPPLHRNFRVSAASFFQVNTAVAGKMVAHLLTNLPLEPSATLLDVYCGVGLFSAFLAPYLGRLIAIEASPAACADFAVNLEEFENVDLYEARAEEALPFLQGKVDLVLVDPPRAGLGRDVLQAIVDRAPVRLAYVSCDPSTLGRDAARLLQAGFRLSQVTPFDLFPQTASIESISFFDRREMGGGS
jgi:23S rRNA (uracil1939-C5)-methyltransferase